MKYHVKAERTEIADIVVVLPDDVHVTSQVIQEELNNPDGKWVIANVPHKTSWLPTSHVEIKDVSA